MHNTSTANSCKHTRCVLQYMGHRLEPRNEAMRRSKVLYNGSPGGLMYGSHHSGTHEYNAEVQHAAHSLSGLGQVSCREAGSSPSFLTPKDKAHTLSQQVHVIVLHH